MLDFLKNVFENIDQYVAAFVAVLGAVIAVAALIPGEQPEKALRGVVDFIEKLSRKPKE